MAKTTTGVDPAAADAYDLAWVRFDRVAAVLLGPPNDEAISGHPLWNDGLETYQFHRVENSAWSVEYETRNRVHPNHRPESWKQDVHYIFTFHDKTLECLADGHTVGLIRSTMRDQLHVLVDQLVGSANA